MNPNFAALLEALPYVAAIVAVSVGGWVFTTWLRIKNGYPLESSWGRPIHPMTDRESGERIKLMELVANPAVDFSRDDDGFG